MSLPHSSFRNRQSAGRQTLQQSAQESSAMYPPGGRGHAMRYYNEGTYTARSSGKRNRRKLPRWKRYRMKVVPVLTVLTGFLIFLVPFWIMFTGMVHNSLDSILRPMIATTARSSSSSTTIISDNFFDTSHLPILIIGGTDGSGTRAFVDTLRTLGVPIVSDDPHTFDFHGSSMFAGEGWPALVKTVLSATNGSANYQWQDFSPYTQTVLTREMKLLLQSITVKYKAMAMVPPKRGGAPISGPQQVSFAIKAPVTMLLLPLFVHFMGNIKFLHVVRDGRDMALSHNQSPVVKFYNVTYKDHEQRMEQWKDDLYPVRAMQLWNDWNLQVREWATQQQSLHTMEYLAMRSEDLVDTQDGYDTKYRCLKALANYVGSSLANNDNALCCESQKGNTDYGVSSVHSEHNVGGGGGGGNTAASYHTVGKVTRKVPSAEVAAAEAKAAAAKAADGVPQMIGESGPFAAQHQRQLEDTPLDETNGKEKVGSQKIEPVSMRKRLEDVENTLQEREIALQQKEAEISKLKGYIEGLQQGSLQEQQLGSNATNQTEVHENPSSSNNANGITLKHNRTDNKTRKVSDIPSNNNGVISSNNVTNTTTSGGSTPLYTSNDNDTGQGSQPVASENVTLASSRRRLQAAEDSAKMVPAHFIKQFSQWRVTVLNDAGGFQVETLEKLLAFGKNLEQQWLSNAQILVGVVDVGNIRRMCERLETLIDARKKGVSIPIMSPLDKPKEEVHERYGKWKTQLQNRTELSRFLHLEGKRALEEFGYEPRAKWGYISNSEFRCSDKLSCKKHHGQTRRSITTTTSNKKPPGGLRFGTFD